MDNLWIIYGLAAFGVMLISMVTGRCAYWKCGIVLLSAWGWSNLVRHFIPDTNLIVSFNCAFDIVMGLYCNRLHRHDNDCTRRIQPDFTYRPATLWISRVFFVMVAIQLAWYFYVIPIYTIPLNILFALQLIVLGGVSVNCLIRGKLWTAKKNRKQHKRVSYGRRTAP